MTEAERVKPRSAFVEEAIAAALEGRWQDAISVNNALIERHGADEGTYNRLGKAHSELGDLHAAIEAYKSALEMNPLNAIAAKQTLKLAALVESSATVAPSASRVDVDLFSEEPGKSALTTLTTPKKSVSVAVAPGDVVELDSADGRLEARTAKGVLIGDVDAKLARRLIPLMETGNRYTAAVTRVGDDGIEVMLREEFQSPENADTPSFPVLKGGKGSDFRPYAKESLLSERGIDSEGLDEDSDDDTEDEEDIDAAMQTSEDFDDTSAADLGDDDDEEMGAIDDEEDDDDDDDDSRPEDSY